MLLILIYSNPRDVWMRIGQCGSELYRCRWNARVIVRSGSAIVLFEIQKVPKRMAEERIKLKMI